MVGLLRGTLVSHFLSIFPFPLAVSSLTSRMIVLPFERRLIPFARRLARERTDYPRAGITAIHIAAVTIGANEYLNFTTRALKYAGGDVGGCFVHRQTLPMRLSPAECWT